MKEPSRRKFFRNSIALGAALSMPSGAMVAHDKTSHTGTLSQPHQVQRSLNLSPARWIWFPSQRTLPNTIILFRKELQLAQLPASARGWILGDSRYKLYVNGERIQFGPAPSDPRWPEADPVDVTKLLTTGTNILGAEVLYYGHGDGTWPIGKPGFIFFLELTSSDGRKSLIVSDNTWQTKVAESWRPGQYKRWYLRAFQEEFDARLYPYGWTTSEFSPDSTWRGAMTFEGAADKPTISTQYRDYLFDSEAQPEDSELRARSITLAKEYTVPVKQLTESMYLRWKHSPEEYFAFVTPDAFTVVRERCETEVAAGTWEVRHKDGDHAAVLTFEFAEQMVGFPRFTINAREGTVVELLVHEAHKPGGDALINTHFHSWTRFICRQGVNHFETFDYEGFRWLQLHIRNTDGPVIVSDVGMRRRMFNWKHTPEVTCNDPTIQKVIHASVNTLYNCAVETIVDGMGRERQQYSGDVGHVLHSVFLTMGEPAMAARFINTYSQGMTSQGFFLDCWPAFDRLARLMEREMQLTRWGPLLDHGVGFTFDCYHYYLYTGEVNSIREAFPRLVKFYNYLQGIMREDDMLPVEGIGVPVVWIDHYAYPKQQHKQCAFNLYAAAMMMHALTPLCRAFQEDTLATQIYAGGAALLAATRKKFWSREHGLFVNNLPWLGEEKEPRLCDRSLATALLFDQCPDGNIANAISMLANPGPNLGLSYPANANWRYWALSKYGDDTFIREVREKWSKMDSVVLNNTLSEDWHAQPDSSAQWSHCPISPLFGMHMCVAGIRPTSPGFSTLEINPVLGDLTSITLTTRTVRGDVRLALQQARGKLTGSVALPPGVSGTLNWKGASMKIKEGIQKIRIG